MSEMKFKAHGSFFVRKGWLGKGLRAVNENPRIFNPRNVAEAMDQLGLGKNMVASLRYWMKTLGLVSESRGKDMRADLTEIGKLIEKNDPYVEEIGTLWCLHCLLVSQKEAATSWYWLFNEFGVGAFTKEEAVDGIQKYALLNKTKKGSENKSGAARSSIESDVDCVLSTYISQERKTGQKTSPENVIDCPFGELGVLDIESTDFKSYKKRRPNLALLPNEIILFSIVNSQKCEEKEGSEHYQKVSETSFDDLLNAKNLPGRVFNLDSESLLSKLYELENASYIRINRTAGSDVIRLSNPDISLEECLIKYYETIG